MVQDLVVLTHAVPETTVTVAVDADTGQVTVQQITTYVLAGTPLSRCNLLKGLHESDGETKAALPLPLEDVLTWDAFVQTQYMDPANPAPADLVRWFQVASFLDDPESVLRIAQLLAKEVDHTVVASDRHRADEQHLPKIFQAVRSLPEGLAGAVLRHTKVPLAQLVVTLPPSVRIAATVARSPGGALLLSGQFCSTMKRAQDVVQALSLPIVKALTLLTHLDLSNNHMGPHAACIAMPLLARLPHLVKLNFSNNAIGSQGFEILTTYLHAIPLLKDLDVSTNRITAADFGEELHTVPALCHLNISVNPLGDAGARDVIRHLPAAPNLTAVNLRLTGVGAEGAAELVKQLPRMANLHVLNLADNKMDPSTVSTFAQGLAAAAALKVLELGGNAVDREAMVQLAAATAVSPCLAKIDVSHVSIGVRTPASPVPEFTQPFPESLRLLNLSNRTARAGKRELFTTEVCNELRLIGLTFERLATIEVLDLTGCVVNQEPFRGVLINLKAIKDLNISRMKVSDIDINLGYTLGLLTSLTTLRAIRSCRHTPANDIDEGPTPSWLPRFQKLTALCHLDLSLRVCEAQVSVNSLTNLTFLELSGNRIDAAGFVALSHAFSKLQSLQHLGLGQTGCRDIDLRGILLLAVELKSLTQLVLSNTKPTPDGLGDVEPLGQSLAQLTMLQVLVWHDAPAIQLAQLGLYFAPLTRLSNVDVEMTKMGASVAAADLLWLGPLSGSLKALNLKRTDVFGDKNMHQTQRQMTHLHCALHLSTLTGLQELNLCGNTYRDLQGPTATNVLNAIVLRLRELRVLKLRNMGLSPEDFAQFAPALGHLAHLSSLDLGRNAALGTLSMRLLARHLSGTLGLAELFLDNIPLACSLSVSGNEDNVVRRALGRCACTKCDRKGLPRLTGDDLPQLPGVGRGFTGSAMRGH